MVLDGSLDESQHEQDDYDKHEAVGDFLRVGSALIRRFSNLRHRFRFRCMRYFTSLLYYKDDVLTSW